MATESTRRSNHSSQGIDDVFLETSESDIRAVRHETAELIDNFHKLSESNGSTKRRMVLLQSEFEAAKSRLESLMHRQPPVTPDYQAYQMMRRISKSTMQRKISQISDS
eukprot:Seg1622.14 transcript_id=Seg1622.14/GoldUCD/mRNA.D3Y31 product="hypothetical protein" protein_id=Seg1622.14/GoldUCD/D3Y31